MVSMGYLEAINFSFIDQEIECQVFDNKNPVEILNPIAANLTVMRSSLMGSLLLDLSNNLSRKQNRVRLFEVGRCFFKDDSGSTDVNGVRQPVKVAGLIYGSLYPEQWGIEDRVADFFDIKGDIERLLATLPVEFKPIKHPALHPGRSAGIYLRDALIGVLGELHPKWQQHYRFTQAPQLFEIDYESISKKIIPAFTALSKYQPVFRDLAFIVKDSVSADQLLTCLRNVSLTMSAQFVLFDRYAGSGVAEGFKSLAYRIVFQDEQTLTEDKIELAISQLIQAAKKQYDAQLRS
jgi:phenylalanyl-tRNA synthetase beta chain